jgi:hypothetical protein
MSKYQVGNTIEFHSNFDYDSNCAVCAKPLGKNHKDILLADGNVLVNVSDYAAISKRGGFVFTAPIGSTCVNNFPVEAVA